MSARKGLGLCAVLALSCSIEPQERERDESPFVFYRSIEIWRKGGKLLKPLEVVSSGSITDDPRPEAVVRFTNLLYAASQIEYPGLDVTLLETGSFTPLVRKYLRRFSECKICHVGDVYELRATELVARVDFAAGLGEGLIEPREQIGRAGPHQLEAAVFTFVRPYDRTPRWGRLYYRCPDGDRVALECGTFTEGRARPALDPPWQEVQGRGPSSE